MWSRVYVVVGHPSGATVCLSHRSTTATTAGGFAAGRWRLQQLSIDSCGRHVAGSGAKQQMQQIIL